MRDLSIHDLASVTGGLTVAEAGSNLVDNVKTWGRAVYGRNASAIRFARDASMPLDRYQATLHQYDIPAYKPIIPTER